MLQVVRSLSRSQAATARPNRLLPEAQVGWLPSSSSIAGLPEPESAARRLAIHGVAVAALAVTIAYLGWRTVATLDLAAWWVSVPLLLLEIHAAIGLALLTVALWDIDRRPLAAPVLVSTQRVAILIPTLDESLDILTPTIAAARAMRVDHETWVLDESARPEVARLAADLGARYLARAEAIDGRAGALNHALEVVTADVVVILHADSVASPDLLVDTLGYLNDPLVALVQTPEGFYNTDSFEHAGGRAGAHRIPEQTVIHRLAQPGRNRWHGAFWTGTGAIIRVAALRDIGGIPTGTVAPDLHTTIRLHRNGWHTVAHNAILARGLAPTTAAIDQVQRQRRATGAMQILRVENPLTATGLSRAQRLSYATALLTWFDAWRWLGIVVLPIVVLLSGGEPIRADVRSVAIAVAVTYFLQGLAQLALTRGCQMPYLSTLLRLVRMTPDLKAVRHLIGSRAAAPAAVGRATPKGRTSDVRRPASEPRLLRTLALVSVFAAAWFGLAIMVTILLGTTLAWATYASFGWLVINVFLLVRAIGRVRDLRFGGERRASVRFETAFAATFDGVPCEVLDLSLRGAGIRIASFVSLDVHRLVLAVDGRDLEIDVALRSTRSDNGGRMVLGLEFLPDQTAIRAEIALALFRTTVVPVRAGKPVGTRVAVDHPEAAGAATKPAAA